MADDFPAALAAQVARASGDPLVTFYDDSTGERVELSFVTYANWVAKTASLLQDELGLERGALVALDLPTHWLGPVWLGAAWSLGVAAGDASAAARADLVVCGPATVEEHSQGSADVVACSLLPMGGRFRDPLPPGVVDFGEVVWAQPDRLLVLDPATPDDTAWVDGEGQIDQASLLSLPGRGADRVVTTTNPATRPGVVTFLGSVLSGAGAVWVAQATPQRLRRIAGDEHAELQQAAPGE